MNHITIIDCGASRTSLGRFSSGKAGLRCEQLEAEIFAPAIAGEPDRWLENTTVALRALGEKKSRRSPVVIVLPPHLVLLKAVKVPRVVAAQCERIVRFEVEQNIPCAVAEVVWDTVVSGGGEADEDLLLVAAKLAVVEPLYAAARRAGFDVQAILPSVLALRAAEELTRSAPDDRLLLLNVGARSATLLQIDGPRFAARTWAMENAPTDKSAGVTRLAQESTRSLLHFQRQHGLTPPTRLVLTGGGAQDPEKVVEIGARLKLPAGTLPLMPVLSLAPQVVDVAANFPGLPDLAGAAILQLAPGQSTVNLMPPALRRRSHLRQRRPWLVAAALMVLTALIPPLLHYMSVAGAARESVAVIEKELGPLRAREARNRERLAQLDTLKVQAAQLQSVLTRRAAWLEFFADLQERFTRVEDVWLENLQTIPAAKDATVKLVISGRMLDRANPLAKVSPETFTRVKALLAGIVDSPFVAAVEEERFDPSRPGVLKFDFVLVTDPARPL